MFWHESAMPGRPIRILVYADPTSSGNPANATLVYSEDTTIKFPLSFTEFQEHVLTTPVTITTGEFYIGVFDLVADEAINFIASYDENTQEGRAYLQVNATDPAGFGLCTGANPQCSTDRTWMVRAFGSTVPSAGELGVFWGEPCNSGVFPEQDFAVYRGTLASLRMGIFDHAPVTCSTRRGGSFRVTDGPPESQYWLVTPTQANLEGSLEPRTPTATCAEVGPDVCP